MEYKFSMKLTVFIAVGFSAAVGARAQVTFNGYTFQDSLSTITDSSGLTVSNALAIQYLTDNSISSGVANVGMLGSNYISASAGNLAGTFSGTAYSAGGGADLVVIGYGDGTNSAWGTFDVSLLLANDTYTTAIQFSDSDVLDTELGATASLVEDDTAYPATFSTPINYSYLPLEISEFDTGGQGVTGIEFSNLQHQWLDISYIGVTDGAVPEATPEPGTLALAGLGLAALVGSRRRK